MNSHRPWHVENGAGSQRQGGFRCLAREIATGDNDEVVIDYETGEVRIRGVQVMMTDGEYRTLEAFACRCGGVVSQSLSTESFLHVLGQVAHDTENASAKVRLSARSSQPTDFRKH